MLTGKAGKFLNSEEKIEAILQYGSEMILFRFPINEFINTCTFEELESRLIKGIISYELEL